MKVLKNIRSITGLGPDARWLRTLGLGCAALGWAFALTGCTTTSTLPIEQRDALDWTAERRLDPYDFDHPQAVVQAVQSPAEFVLVREFIATPGSTRATPHQGAILRVPLVEGQPLGFEKVDAYHGYAVAGEVKHPIQTTAGVQFVWYRQANEIEIAAATAGDVVGELAPYVFLLGLAYLIHQPNTDDDPAHH